MKTKEQIHKYNKEYSARPKVIAHAKVRNARPERKAVRKLYKKSAIGKAAERRYVVKNREKINKRLWIRNLKVRYGMTEADYNKMLTSQKGRCFICGRVEDIFHIDHCHKTGKVRGLLCGSCNRALGLFKDNPDNLKKAIEYLMK